METRADDYDPRDDERDLITAELDEYREDWARDDEEWSSEEFGQT